MTPQKQLFRHDPENGVYGDCHRAAIASILDQPVADVPHFCEGDPDPETFNRRVRDYFASRGFCPITTVFDAEGGLDVILHSIKVQNPGTYFLLSGTSRTGCDHTVVACDGEIVHDPSLTDAGIIGPCSDGYFWAVFLGAAVAVKGGGPQ